MGLVKNVLVGAICMSVGYCIGVARSQYQESTAFHEEVVQEEIRTKNLDALTTFLQHYTPSPQKQHHQKKESASLLDLWNSLPQQIKERFLEKSKDALEHTVTEGYQSLREQSGALYEEMRYFVNKKINGEEK
jgi:hypothetical protein